MKPSFPPANLTAQPQYDFGLIQALEGLIADGERGWRELYTELGVTPYEVVYEDLVTDEGWDRAIRGVLDHLDVRPADMRIPGCRTHRQSDGLNEDWVGRYRTERAGRAEGAEGV